jgi:SAM-dependent methyltransferase
MADYSEGYANGHAEAERAGASLPPVKGPPLASATPGSLGAQSSQPAAVPSAVPSAPAADPSTATTTAFEPGIVSMQTVQSDPAWVESDIGTDHLSQSKPWTYTLTYKDGSTLVIPLEQVFNERLPGATITVYRRHRASRRIVPCVISRADPRLKAVAGPVGDFGAIADLAVPRFDATTTPHIVSMVNAAQMIWAASGMLEVIKLQSMNPLAGGVAGTGSRAGASAAAKVVGGAAQREGMTFVEIGAGDLRAAIDLAKRGGVKVIAVDPAAASAAAVKELEALNGQFVQGVAADLAPSTADHVYQYFPWTIEGAGRSAQGGTWRLIDDAVRLLKPGGAGHFVTEDLPTAEFLAKEASQKGLRAVITKTAAGAAAPGASGSGVPGFAQKLEVWMVNIYKGG